MEELEKLKEKFKDFVKNSFEELGVLVDKFDFDFSGPVVDLYSEVYKSKKLIKKFAEIDFVLNVSLDELGKVPYKPPVDIYPFTEKGNMFAIYSRYKPENGVFVEDIEMTGYRTFEGIPEDPVVWVQFGFVKKPSLPAGFVKKYKSKGFNYYSNFHYNYESLRSLCTNLELSFKNLNVLL